MAQVTFDHVTKKFGDFIAVEDFNIRVKDGEFVVLVGPSGCGKTTILRMLAGLEDVTEGNICIDDILVNDLPPKDRDVAMVFQSYALYPHMNVYDNMAFSLKMRKFPRKEIDPRVKEAARILGMEDQLYKRPGQLSGGQRQRVALGRAIVRHPKVFLFDEPLSNLDAKLRVAMRAELAKLHYALKTTMLYVTHDQAEAMTLGERVVVMDRGLVQQVDEPQRLYDHPQNLFVAGFIGSPSMNFIECSLARKGDGIRVVTPEFSLRVPQDLESMVRPYLGKEVVFGIRPEDMYDRFFVGEVPEDSTISAEVEVKEPMGSDLFLYLKAGEKSILARVNPNTRIQVGERIDVFVDMKKMHLFDKSSKRIIV